MDPKPGEPAGSKGCSSDLVTVVDDKGAAIKKCAPDQGCFEGECIEACAAAGTAEQKLVVLADGYRAIYNASGDIIRIVTDAAAAAPFFFGARAAGPIRCAV